VIDDLHWAQPGLLEIVEHIAESSRESPIMLLFLARPELFDSVEGWGGGKLNSISELLTALSSDGTRQLLDRFPIPPAVVEQVVTTADGNPLFAEQLVAMLVDQGHLVDHEGVLAWSGSSDAVELAMPPSISALLAARIDRLSDAERGVLESAAVIGTVFYVEAVAHLSGISPDEVAHVLGRLVRKELLRSAEATLPGVTAFRFLHVLVRDAAYEGIAKGKRAEWHERLAEWLLELDVGGVENGLVGHHLVAAWRYRRQLGPDDERSRNLASRAAEQLAAASRLLEMSDLAAAASLMEQAVHILPTDSEQRVDLALSLGSQLFQSGELARARALLVPMTSLPSQADSGRARLLISRIDYVTQGDSGMRLAEVVAELIPVLTRAGDHHALSEVYLVQSEYNLTRGDYPAATTSLELAVEHAQLAGDLVGAARARAYLPIVHCFGPTPAEEAIRILDQLAVNAGNDTRVLGEVEQMTCILHAMCGRLDLAKSIAAQARAHLQESGQVLFLANFGQSSGVILTLAKEFDAADREYAESCFALESLGESSYLSTVAGMRAQLLARRGLFDEARRVREYAGAHLTEDDVLTQLLLREVDALLAAVDSPDEARAIIAKAHDESKVFISPDNVGEFHMSAALVGQRIGDSALTERHLLRAQELFRQKGNVVREQAATEALRP
jgi:tetratricopeptide (TPR) repeat protein